MPTFIEITPDPFAEQFRKETLGDPTEEGTYAGSIRANNRNFAHVRRPVRGIQIKEDTYATLQVRKANGTPIPLLDGGALQDDEYNPGIGVSKKYSNFLIQSMQESRSEKSQVVLTFGEPFIFFFGEHPRVVQGQGILLNTEDFNWRAEFWENYDRYLRGTKCVQQKSRVTLSWDDIVIEGYFLQATATESSGEPNFVNFQFQIFLTNYQNVSTIGSSDFPSGSFEGNVFPNEIDIPGSGKIPDASSTALVRQLNIQNPNTGSLDNSLLDALRSEASEIVRLENRLASLTELTRGVIDTNNRVRVPLGFAGGSVFDQETQIALASIPPNQHHIILKDILGQENFYLSTSGVTYQPAKYGKIRDSADEYIAKLAETANAPEQPQKSVEEQFAERLTAASDVESKVRDIYAKFGVDTEPTRGVIELTRALNFGSLFVRPFI